MRAYNTVCVRLVPESTYRNRYYSGVAKVGPMMQWVSANTGIKLDLPHMPQFTDQERELFKEQITDRQRRLAEARGDGGATGSGVSGATSGVASPGSGDGGGRGRGRVSGSAAATGTPKATGGGGRPKQGGKKKRRRGKGKKKKKGKGVGKRAQAGV